MPALSPLMTVMMRAGEKASRSLLRDFGELENLQVSEKSPGQFVTAADRRAEKIIHENLSQDRPDFGFLMEEAGEIKGNDPERRFIIDPLDGTHNFMRGIPNWCISIGFEEQGEITAGLIINPVMNEMFYAEKGQGAWSRNNRRLRVSGKKTLDQSTIAYWFVFDREYRQEPMHQCRTVEDSLRKQAGSMRQIGSTCLELAWIAAGRMDGYIQGPLSPWDLAAASLIVREAGGAFTDWQGRKENAVHSPYAIAGNPDIHQALLRLAEKGC